MSSRRRRPPYHSEYPNFHIAYIVSRLPIPSVAEGHFLATGVTGHKIHVNFHVNVRESDGYITLYYDVDGIQKTQGFFLKRVNFYKKFWRMRCVCNVHVAKGYFHGGSFKCKACLPFSAATEKCKTVEQILNLFRRAETRQQKIKAIYSYLVFKRMARLAIIYQRPHGKIKRHLVQQSLSARRRLRFASAGG